MLRAPTAHRSRPPAAGLVPSKIPNPELLPHIEKEGERKRREGSKRKREKKHIEESEDVSEDETEESIGSQDTDEDSEYEDDIVEEKHVIKSGSNKFNIIFKTIEIFYRIFDFS